MTLRTWHLLAPVVVVALSALGQTATAEDELSMAQQEGVTWILDGDRAVLRYRADDDVPMKPYADQLFTPKGVQILRNAPADHKHHHGLMFAVKVDGVNYWEELEGKSGKQVHKEYADASNATEGVDRAGFVETLEWMAPNSDQPQLLEERQVQVAKTADLGATLVLWQTRLQTPPGKDSVSLTGTHYHGLGMRFLESMDKDGRFFNADDNAGEVVKNTEKLTATKWCAYTAKVNGKPVTVALFDAPKNVRHPAKMFTMTAPFAYLSATRGEWKEPLVAKTGQPLELRYGVALWDGEVDKATVEKVYQQWLKLADDKN